MAKKKRYKKHGKPTPKPPKGGKARRAAKKSVPKKATPKKPKLSRTTGKKPVRKKTTKPINKPKSKPKKQVVKKKKVPVKGKPVDYTLYHNGKKLRKVHIDAVILTASQKSIDVSTPYRLYRFYNKYKDTFAILFDSGLTSLKMGTTQFIEDMNEASDYSKEYYIDVNEKSKRVTKDELIWHVITIENYMNEKLDTTFFQLSYTFTFDNKIIVKLPSYSEVRELEDEDTEYVSDYLLENFDILVYRNESDDDDKSHIRRAKTYKSAISKKLKKARSAKKNKKGQAKHKKRK